jgi:hypothetical protein
MAIAAMPGLIVPIVARRADCLMLISAGFFIFLSFSAKLKDNHQTHNTLMGIIVR